MLFFYKQIKNNTFWCSPFVYSIILHPRSWSSSLLPGSKVITNASVTITELYMNKNYTNMDYSICKVYETVYSTPRAKFSCLYSRCTDTIYIPQSSHDITTDFLTQGRIDHKIQRKGAITEYTQSGNGHFLAYIPSWWKNLPRKEWGGGGGWMPTSFH
jgi:hypothetical protein